MHSLKQIVCQNIRDHHTISIINNIFDGRNNTQSYTPETAAMIADRSEIAQRSGKRTQVLGDEARQLSKAGKRHDADLLTDQEKERITVLIRARGAEENKENPQDDKATKECYHRFAKYRHHQYVRRWGLFSDDEGKDEEWFIANPEILPEDDPDYLCDLCRQIDFRALLTLRNLPGNHDPRQSSIKLGGLSKVMQNEHCAFCSLLRRQIEREGLLDGVPEDELQDHGFDLNVLDEGPDYALRLEVELSDIETNHRPRFIIQVIPDDAPLPLEGRSVDPNVANLPGISRWLRDCRINHGYDSSPKQVSFEAPKLRLRLVDTEDMCVREVEPPFEYVCLSYVWGVESHTQYTTSTSQTLEQPQGLLDSSVDLQKTIRDAITVTQKLGFRYIWIDALCILQDDDSDKAKIISNMGTIYGSATLAITSLGNHDPAKGLPGVSIPRSNTQITSRVQGMNLSVAFQDDRKDNLEIEQSSWNSRAWTFQERALSKRILYFTDAQVYLKCPHATIFEDTVPVLDPEYKPLIQNDQMQYSSKAYHLWTQLWGDTTQAKYPNKAFTLEGQTVIFLAEDPNDPEKTYDDDAPLYEFFDAPRPRSGVSDLVDGETPWEMYKRAVDSYTKRKMKFQDDAVNAFLGIADLIRQGVNTDFWYGMPEFAFEESLLWHPCEPLKRRMKDGKPLFPSWSWAAWEGHCSYRGRGWYNAIKLPSASIIKYLERLEPEDYVVRLRQKGHLPEEELEDVISRVRQSKVVFSELDLRDLQHWRAEEDGWTVHANKARNFHLYEHEAYPGVKFNYPVTLPGQPVRRLVAEDGTVYFVAHVAPARFCDMSATKPVQALGHDNYLQIGISDEGRSSNFRPSWRRIIYHQGYRAGFLSLNTPMEDLDLNFTYHLAAISRDTLSSIESPVLNWDLYWNLDPVTVQRDMVLEAWDSKLPPASRKPDEDAEASTRSWNENGDAHWDEGRFGTVRVLDVYNVLLLKKDQGTGRSERVGVGKMSHIAFHGVPTADLTVQLN